ncbi:hypothetical protein ACPOL_0995 [Acidisarcina polymorpha]|uniref:Uncharacterized protein n=1 Tax=Acidisarcina polymorpha TaxID=2211140 RepID=A0A2Z5FVA5_9BACT|nr:hypothetical protein ACPOL_0995 [Acidisarcina polymorpha]
MVRQFVDIEKDRTWKVLVEVPRPSIDLWMHADWRQGRIHKYRRRIPHPAIGPGR